MPLFIYNSNYTQVIAVFIILWLNGAILLSCIEVAMLDRGFTAYMFSPQP